MGTTIIEKRRKESAKESGHKEEFMGYPLKDIINGRERGDESPVERIKFLEAREQYHANTEITSDDGSEKAWAKSEKGGLDNTLEIQNLIAENENTPEYQQYLRKEKERIAKERADIQAKAVAARQLAESEAASKEERERRRNELRARMGIYPGVKIEEPPDTSQNAGVWEFTPEQRAEFNKKWADVQQRGTQQAPKPEQKKTFLGRLKFWGKKK